MLLKNGMTAQERERKRDLVANNGDDDDSSRASRRPQTLEMPSSAFIKAANFSEVVDKYHAIETEKSQAEDTAFSKAGELGVLEKLYEKRFPGAQPLRGYAEAAAAPAAPTAPTAAPTMRYGMARVPAGVSDSNVAPHRLSGSGRSTLLYHSQQQGASSR